MVLEQKYIDMEKKNTIIFYLIVYKKLIIDLCIKVKSRETFRKERGEYYHNLGVAKIYLDTESNNKNKP